MQNVHAGIRNENVVCAIFPDRERRNWGVYTRQEYQKQSALKLFFFGHHSDVPKRIFFPFPFLKRP